MMRCFGAGLLFLQRREKVQVKSQKCAHRVPYGLEQCLEG